MGKSYTPPYRLEMSGVTTMCWHVTNRYQIQGDGKPTYDNLVKFIESYNKSIEFGGVNYHVSKALRHIPYPTWARIVRQKDNVVMAEWKAPMFQLV